MDRKEKKTKEVRMIYSEADSFIAKKNNDKVVNFKPTLLFYDRIFVALYLLAYLIIGVAFLYLLFSSFTIDENSSVRFLSMLGFISLLSIEFLRMFQGFSIPYLALRAKDPIYQKPPQNLKIALLTTIVPSKEPIAVVEKTLQAMKNIRYETGKKVDVWILDEGDDERVKEMAKRLEVKHFSRKGILKYNQSEGEFRAKTKAGNHNSWRAEHEDDYDIVAQMDPDHVPFPNFLERILGYFSDPAVGFVVAPQVYGNQKESFIAKASAEQAYLFHGIIQRAGNNSFSPLLIGTNHAYRTTAWKQIGGYQDSIIEDHLTSLKLHSTKIKGTNHTHWKGVYTPDILSIGEGPTTWTDYFNQQKRWAYGVWEIMLNYDFKYLSKLNLVQKFHYVALQLFYPSVAVTWILSVVVSTISLTLGISFLAVNPIVFFTLWAVSLGMQLLFSVWVMSYNLNSYERKSTGLLAMLLTMLVAPVYSAAAIAAILKRKLNYAVTAKGDLRTLDTWSTFSTHFIFIGVYLALVFSAIITERFSNVSFYWVILTLITLLPLPTWFLFHKAKEMFGFSLSLKYGNFLMKIKSLFS